MTITPSRRSPPSAAVAFAAGGLCVLLFGFSPADQGRSAQDPEGVLRVRGIVIVDEEGRERILIGAPLPDAAHRIRTDMDKVKGAWGDRFSNFDWYERLNHSTTGIVILDENGHDRIAIGDPMPDPNIGRRIAPSTGIQINDEQGFERSGWGYFEARNSVGLGLDRRDGEGLNLIVSDTTSGVLINEAESKSRTFLGNAPGGWFGTGRDKPFQGLIARRGGEESFALDAIK